VSSVDHFFSPLRRISLQGSVLTVREAVKRKRLGFIQRQIHREEKTNKNTQISLSDLRFTSSRESSEPSHNTKNPHQNSFVEGVKE
jgi:hypothetical protein